MRNKTNIPTKGTAVSVKSEIKVAADGTKTGRNMKYAPDGEFTTQQMSIHETLNQLGDCVSIAKTLCDCLNQLPENIRADIKYALALLAEAESYIPYIEKKTKIALSHVPTEIQGQEYL